MISRAKIHCNGVTTVQDIRDYASLIFGTQCSFCFSLSLSLSLSLSENWNEKCFLFEEFIAWHFLCWQVACIYLTSPARLRRTCVVAPAWRRCDHGYWSYGSRSDCATDLITWRRIMDGLPTRQRRRRWCRETVSASEKRPPGLIPARHEPEVGATMLAEKRLRPRQEMSLNFCKFFIILFSFTAVSYCTVLYCVVLYGTVVYCVLYVFIVCCHLA